MSTAQPAPVSSPDYSIVQRGNANAVERLLRALPDWFYRVIGYLPLEELQNFWPEDPALFLVKPL